MKTQFLKISALVGLAALAATATGCLNDSGSRKDSDAHLVVVTGVQDINSKGLGKSATITLKKLIVTLTSSNVADSVRRDTVLADTGAFSSVATENQSVLRNYSVKPLRSWTIVVKTLDANDSVIHYDSTVAASVLAGETRPVTFTLASRFVMYEAKFTVPDSLNYQVSAFKENLVINRVVLRVNGVIVADSTRSPRFEPSTTSPLVSVVHTVRFDYIRTNLTPTVKVEFYGHVGAYPTDGKLFESEFVNVNPNGPNPVPVSPGYVGPPSDQIAQLATAGLVINIGKVGTVVFNTSINGNVAGKTAAP